MRLTLIAAALATACTFAQAAPVQVFESSAATGGTNRAAASGVLTRFEVSAGTTITNIAIETDLASAGGLQYFIFNSITGALLYQSALKAFADDGLAFKLSDAFSFDLNVGTRYAIGAVADVASVQAFVFPGALTVGAISSLGKNQNIFAGVFDGGLNFTDGRIRLFVNGTTAVPEPATLALVGLGLLAASAIRRKAA